MDAQAALGGRCVVLRGGTLRVRDIHQTAVVTSVTPDGVVHYTRHSDNKVNLSLQGRERHIEQGLGEQQFIVGRVDPAEK